jgi:hypothetical protein
MQKTALEMLQKVGEHGYGEHVLVIAANIDEKNLHFKSYFDRKYKLQYFNLDLRITEEDLSKMLTRTLNYLHYAKNFILDWPAFTFFAKNLKRTSHLISEPKRFVIFNPVKFNKKIIYPKYIGLDNSKLYLPKEILKIDIIDYMHFINASNTNFIALQDPKFSLKLASLTRNSSLDVAENFEDALNLISRKFD